MGLIWMAIAIICLSSLLAGAQVVRLLRDRDAAIDRLEIAVRGLERSGEATRHEVMARNVLLRQAQAWLQAQQDKMVDPAP